MSILKVTDETTREELAEAIRHFNARTIRMPHITGRSAPSDWDRAHERLNALLDDLERAT